MLVRGVERNTTRSKALAAGEKRYFSDRACPKGHQPPVLRHTDSGSCVLCANAYSLEVWRKGLRRPVDRAKVNKKWNNSSKGRIAKKRWADKDPMWAWTVGVVGGARCRSRDAGAPFDLTNEYVRSIVPEKCPVFDVPLTFLKGDMYGASIDKLIPSGGYVKGNVAVISRRANMIKSDASAEEVEAVARWMRSQECRK